MVSAHSDGDTIAAIATPPGRGGISIVRISGPGSRDIIPTVFSGSRDPLQNDRVMVYGHIVDSAYTLDEVLAVSMQAPHSYTGEDVVEIHSHGGYAAAEAILALVISRGARHALPGEFTKRAFLNGKLDLAQAEAVMEIVSAVSREHLSQAEHLFEGAFSNKIRALLNTIRQTLSLLEYEIDFAEEHAGTFSRAEIQSGLEGTLSEIENLIGTYSVARQIKEGLTVVLAGNVNAGKSSLFNAILGTRRAIVSSRPGTTRDWLEARMDIDGHTINLIDTAGLRTTDDEIESEGVSETRRLLDDADIVIMLHDAEDREDTIQHPLTLDRHKIDVFSKADLVKSSTTIPAAQIPVSSKDHTGINILLATLTKTVHSIVKDHSSDSLILIGRHKTELAAARKSISSALETIPDWSEEIISYELSDAAAHLSAILGENIDLDVLDRIFASFCVGK